MANLTMMDDRQRASIETRVIEQLQRLDDSTLKELDAWLAKPVVAGQPEVGKSKRGMTRRQAITATLLGGAAVAGAGVAGNMLGESGALTEGAARIASMNETIDEWQNRANELGNRVDDAMGLITMFDNLDNIGLDDVVNAGLAAVASAIGGAALTAQTLREGLLVARNNLNQLDEGLAVLDNGLVGVENAVSRLSDLMQALEDRLQAAGEPVAPITNALGGFFTRLIGMIPFGVGDQINATIERIQSVISAIPESIENINRDLIEPLRARFFPRQGDDVQVRLLDPLTNLLFTPAEQLLGHLARLAETWQSALQRPAEEKLAARADLRKQIEEYRVSKGL